MDCLSYPQIQHGRTIDPQSPSCLPILSGSCQNSFAAPKESMSDVRLTRAVAQNGGQRNQSRPPAHSPAQIFRNRISLRLEFATRPAQSWQSFLPTQIDRRNVEEAALIRGCARCAEP